MSLLRRRRRDTEEAARKLTEAERRVIDVTVRLVRLEADTAVYTMRKRRPPT